MDQLEVTRHRSRVSRLRDRVFVVLTANVAVVCVWATQYVSQEYVLTPNSARFFLMMVTPPAAASGPRRAEPEHRPGSIGVFDSAPENPREVRARLERQIGWVEGIVYVWRRVMWSVAGFLELVALLVVITRRSRLLHLRAGVVILLSTVATLVGMRLLIDPDHGGMEPLAIRAHIYVAAVQSAYGVVLLIAFARRPRLAAARAGASS